MEYAPIDLRLALDTKCQKYPVYTKYLVVPPPPLR